MKLSSQTNEPSKNDDTLHFPLKILIVGTVRNVAKTLGKNFSTVSNAFGEFSEVKFLFVESDSTDKTVDKLELLKHQYANVEYITLGKLSDTLKTRVERIRHCRNVYVNYIQRHFPEKAWDLIVVIDFDDRFFRLQKDDLLSALERRAEWDVCCSNQKNGYYDIYALRHQEWNPTDSYRTLNWFISIKKISLEDSSLLSFFKNLLLIDQLFDITIAKKMIKLKTQELVYVDSAFGGLAIYNAIAFLESDYSCEDSIYPECEHVTFHRKLRAREMKICIDPSLVTANWNFHNLNRLRIWRLTKLLIRIGTKRYPFSWLESTN